jgi:hypothetical protein
MKQILSILILSAVLFGCQKSSTESSTYTLTGIVADYDSKTPVAGATVYINNFGIKKDSAISDVNGRASFTFPKNGELIFLSTSKANYLLPLLASLVPVANADRTDSLFLVRPSFVNLTTHKANTYLPTDSISVSINNIYTSPSSTTGSTYKEIARDKTDVADKNFTFSTFYKLPQSGTGILLFSGYQKVYVKWDIIRSGTILSSNTDSVTLIQFGIKNITINY